MDNTIKPELKSITDGCTCLKSSITNEVIAKCPKCKAKEAKIKR